MYRSVKKVVPNEDFTLTVAFDNGEECTLDMKPYWDFGVFQRIRDYDQFKRVRVALDTVEGRWIRPRPRVRIRQVQDHCPRITPATGRG
jgi:hypothetical protein